MRKAFIIGLKDLRLRLRDRSAVMLAFVAPLILATIISLAFGREEVTFRTTFVIVDLDHSDISRSFVEGLEGVSSIRDALTIRTTDSADEARVQVEKHKAGAGIVIPTGFAAGVQSGQSARLVVLKDVEAPIAAVFADAIASAFAAEIDAGRLALQTAVGAGALNRPGSGGLNALIQKAVSERIPTSVIDGRVGVREVKAASYFGPGMAIFFLLFTVQFGALGIISERREGTLARLLASPTRASVVVVGKVVSAFVLGLLSIFTMVVSTTLLLKADWGDPLAVAAISVAMVLAAMGVTGLVIVLARTPEQAQGFAQICAVGLALLGGNFVQITDAPKVIRTLSLFTPNGWALRAFFDLSATGGGIATVLPALGAILAFAVVTGSLALIVGKRLVVA